MTPKGGNDVIKRVISTTLAAVIIACVAVGFPRERAAATIGGTTVATAAGAGIFPAGASFNGIELAGGTFGVGTNSTSTGTANGDLELQLNGNSIIGLSQWITVSGWITQATLNADGTITMNGTGTLDMGDGTAPTGGLALVANLSVSGIQVTIGGTALPVLPKSDGYISIE